MREKRPASFLRRFRLVEDWNDIYYFVITIIILLTTTTIIIVVVVVVIVVLLIVWVYNITGLGQENLCETDPESN